MERLKEISQKYTSQRVHPEVKRRSEIPERNLGINEQGLIFYDSFIFMSNYKEKGLPKKINEVREKLSSKIRLSGQSETASISHMPMQNNDGNHERTHDNELLAVSINAINSLFQKISPLYMNKSAVYSDEYYEENHLRRLNSWYGGLVKRYYRYVAEIAMAEAAEIPKQSRILDIGCGVGILVEQFNKLGYQAEGVDVNEAAVQHSIEPLHCQLVETTAQLPYPDNYFDLVTSREVLEHIPREAIDDCIVEWDRVSKGKMVHIIAVRERGKSATEDPTHINIQTEDWWSQKFEEHGYETIKNPSPYYVSLFGPKGYLLFIKK